MPRRSLARALATLVSVVGAVAGASACTTLLGDFRDGSGGAGGSGSSSVTSATTAGSSSTASSSMAGGSTSTGAGGVGGATASSSSSSGCTLDTCSLLPPQCCPAGEHCVAGAMGDVIQPLCSPEGTNEPGTACTTDKQCAGASTCYLGLCRSFCQTSIDCGGDPCGLGVFDQDSKALGYVCANTCDPLGATGCPAGFRCTLNLNDLRSGWVPECIPAGQHTAGQSCAAITECVAGTVCFDGAPSACHRVCVVGAPNNCPGSTKCQLFPYGGAFANQHEYGYCI